MNDKDSLNVRLGPDTGNPILDGVGCILEAIAFAIVLWALVGFPGVK